MHDIRSEKFGVIAQNNGFKDTFGFLSSSLDNLPRLPNHGNGTEREREGRDETRRDTERGFTSFKNSKHSAYIDKT